MNEPVSGESRGRTGGQKEPASVPAGHNERVDQGSDNGDVEERGQEIKTLPGGKARIAGVRNRRVIGTGTSNHGDQHQLAEDTSAPSAPVNQL